MTLGTTTYLLGLSAIAIPIAIHLWSKKTRKTIPFGTIRFLSEDDTQAIKSLIPSEWLLLFLRILMLVVLVLIMCEPLWNVSRQEKELILIDPDYEIHPNFRELKDSLQEYTNVRWFSHGFPMIGDSLIASDVSHWELLKSLRSNTANITVLSPRRLTQYIGTKPKVSNVTWVSLPQDPQTTELGVFSVGSGAINVSAVSDQNATYFSHDPISKSSEADSLVVTVAIQADDSYIELEEFMLASIGAINEDSPLRIRLTDEANAKWLIWLKNEPAPKRRNLLYATNTSGQEIINQVSHNVFEIANFQLEAFLSYNFPIKLEQILGQGAIEIVPFDWRELPENQLPPYTVNASSDPLEVTESLSKWFWGLMLIILVAERYLSLKTSATE